MALFFKCAQQFPLYVELMIDDHVSLPFRQKQKLTCMLMIEGSVLFTTLDSRLTTQSSAQLPSV